MPSTLSSAVRAILIAALVALTLSPSVRFANAQRPAATGDPYAAASKGLDRLLEDARQDGSTVIVVRPGTANDATSAENAGATLAARVLKARARVEAILRSAPTLLPNAKQALRHASPDGGEAWLVRALATAFGGFLVGWLAITRIQKAGVQYFRYFWNPEAVTTADKAKYLLFRVVLAFVYASVFFLMVMAVTVVLDPGLAASRRLIFEVALAYALFRVMRRGVSWNLFAYDAPSHRLVNLADDEAIRIDRAWNVTVAVVLVLTAILRFFIFVGEEQSYANLNPENVLLLQICAAAIITLAILIFTATHWRSLRGLLVPRDAQVWMYGLRVGLARLLPGLLMLYFVCAFVMFVFRLALAQPVPGLVIAAPFVILFVSMIVFGYVLMVIQAIYDRRRTRFDALAAAERAKREREAEQLDSEAGEVMVHGPSASGSEYRPVFRSFFENAALVIIGAIALRELGRMWGVDVGADGNIWSAFLTIALVSVLCWLCYRAVGLVIDQRLAQETVVPDEKEDESGGEGGRRGESRMATLLPILRYMMIIVLFSAAGMVILSTAGFDIGPIFAGAGVVGIAVGFGAQTLIRDIFSGAFFLMDDAFRKGEYVSTGNIKGTIEKISIRSFQLRHHLGALHTIPFGEVKQLTNYSRDWVMTKLPLRVTYDTDVEKVRKLIKKLGERLLQHPQIGHTFMEPLKSQGVYRMEDSAMIIRVKFKTRPGEQFVTRKVIYESIQEEFAKAGIQFAHREVTVRLADDHKAGELSEKEKRAVSSAARSVIDSDAEAQTRGESASGGR